MRKLFGLVLAVPGAVGAVTLVLPNQGYVLIDDGYYVFERPRSEGAQVELRSRGGDGFQLRAFVGALDPCQRLDGSAVGPGGGQPRVLYGESDTLPSGLGLGVTGNPATVSLVHCEGTPVLAFRTTDNRASQTRCTGFLSARPFAGGRCRALDAVDPGYLFHSDFATS